MFWTFLASYAAKSDIKGLIEKIGCRNRVCITDYSLLVGGKFWPSNKTKF